MALLKPTGKWRPEVMTARQAKALERLSPIAREQDWYLAGGTALALRLGHRRSVDLDWFCSNTVDPLAAAALMRDRGVPLEVGGIATGTLHGKIHGVRISLFEFRYPLLARTSPWGKTRCGIAGLRDIACMKLAAVAQRGSRKDFVDIWALITTGMTLGRMLADYRRKFGVSDVGTVLYGLGYFEDAESEPMPRMLLKVSWARMRKELSAALKRLANGTQGVL